MIGYFCPDCGNHWSSRQVKSLKTGAFGRALYEKEVYCACCEWNGTKGPGKRLRELIKQGGKHG
jgi:hypothetical protein